MEDVKFCMSLKAMIPDEKRTAWIRRRAEWWAERRLSKSSEDIWDIRECVICNYLCHSGIKDVDKMHLKVVRYRTTRHKSRFKAISKTNEHLFCYSAMGSCWRCELRTDQSFSVT